MSDQESTVRQNVSGTGNIFSGTGDVSVIGYSADQVSALLEQVSTAFQPRPFDGHSPYVGLSAFEAEDADRFFGREKLISELLTRVERSRFIVITGPSGSGKSSLVRAGLIPALRTRSLPESDRWLYTTLKPGREPLEQLAWAVSRLAMPGAAGSAEAGDFFRRNHSQDLSALHKVVETLLSDRPAQRALIFCDQFEEVFTQVSQAEDRAFFLNLLTYSATVEGGRVIVIVAMRSDFVSHCAAYPHLNALLNQQFFQVGGMQPEELVKAIALPALQVGLKVDPDLIAQIISDMRGEPGALPLTQFALKDLFDAQRKAGSLIALTLTDYLKRGGIHESLARHADAEFSKLSPLEQELARTIFIRLIQVRQDGQDTRRTALVQELVLPGANQSEIEGVIDKLASARLITSDKQEDNTRTVTISHEKLIDAWPWLHKLVEENRDALVIQNQIATDAQEWDENQRDSSYLYIGARLVTAREKLTEKKLALSPLALTFLDAGINADEEKERREEARRKKELEDARTLAEERRKRLEETRRLRYVSIAQALAAQAPRQMVEFGQHERAALLARQAYLFHEANGGAVLDQIDEALRTVLTQPYFAVTLAPPSESVTSCLAYSSDGLQLAVGHYPFLYLVPANGPGNWQPIFENKSGKVTTVAFGPHDNWLAWGTWRGNLYLKNLRDSQHAFVELGAHESTVNSVAFSPDGKTLASAGGNSVRLWRLATPEKPFAILPSQDDEVGEVSSVTFSPDGKLLVSSASDRQIRIWNPRRLKQPPRFLQGTRIWAHAIAFGSNSLLAAAGDMGQLEIWDLSTDPPNGYALHAPMAQTVAFSPDGRSLAVGGMHSYIEVHDVNNLEAKPYVLRGHSGQITQLAFAPDGTKLASSSEDGTVRLWDMRTAKAQPIVRPYDERLSVVTCVASDGDGDRIAASFQMGFVQIFDMREPLQTRLELRGDALGPVHGAIGIGTVAFIPNRNALLTRHNSELWIWDLDHEPARPVSLSRQPGWIGAAAVSSDGNLVASCGGDGWLRLWQTSNASAKPVAIKIISVETNDAFSGLRAIAFSPSTPLLATGGQDGGIFLIRVDKLDEKPQALNSHARLVQTLAFSPDGSLLVSGSDDQKARVLHLETDQSFDLPHEGEVCCVTFSPEGKWLATGSTDGVIRLWELYRPGTSAVVLRGHQGRVSSLAFAGDGKWLVSGGQDGTVRFWIPWTGELAEMVCTRVARNLDQDEWRRFVGENIAYEPTCPILPA